MNLLAFDSSSDFLSLAVEKGKGGLCEYQAPSFTRHSEALMPAIEKILKKARLSPSQLEGLAVGTGPGSFTGLRVGLAAAKTMAYALKIPLVGVSSLESIARCQKKENIFLVPLIDARRGQVYGAVYERSPGNFKTVIKPSLFEISELLKKIRGSAVFSGSGAVIFKKEITAASKVFFVEENPALSFPKASSVLEAAAVLFSKKKFTAPENLLPEYLRPKDCNALKK